MKNKSKSGLSLWCLLSPKGIAPLWLVIILSGYCLAMFVAAHFVSVRHNAGELLSKERWVIVAVCALLVEVLNQVTYRLGKKKPGTAALIKCVTFWCIFTAGIISYIYLAHGLQAASRWRWSETAGHVLVYIAFSWVFPIYSVSTNVRFFFLHGKFRMSAVDVFRSDERGTA